MRVRSRLLLTVFACLLVAAGCAASGGREAPARPPDPTPPPPFGSVATSPHVPNSSPGPPRTADGLLDDRLPPPPPAVEHSPADWPFDIWHYRIAVDLDFETRSLDGRVAIRARALREGVREFPLHCDGLDVHSVTFGGGGPVDFEVADGMLRIVLPEPSLPGRDFDVTIHYSGTPQRGLYFNLATAGSPTDPRQAFTQGECEDTRFWMPCHDAPDDFATHDVEVTVPRGMRVMAAGRFTGVVAAEGGRETWRFRMDHAHVSYLTTFVAGDYRVLTEDGAVPLEYVVSEQDAEHARHSLRHTADVLRFVGEYTGHPYPYPKYAQTTVRDYMFGGMENISATTLTDRTIHPPDWEPARTSRGLVAHEVAHQWFGDLCTCGEWAHIWLNEGFATYFEKLHLEHAEGRDAFLVAMRGARKGGMGAYDGEKRPVVSRKYVDPFDLFDGHSYAGGAARLHMLREMLGDKVFRDAVKTYLDRHRGGNVRTEDFRAAAETASGEDLGWWFDQWLLGPGYPKLKVRWTWNGEKGFLDLTVEQTQSASGGVPPAFRLPFTVAFDLRSGETVTRHFELDGRRHAFEVVLPSEPRYVRPDPRTVLLARYDLDRSVSAWSGLAALDPNPSGRIDALEALGKIVGDGKRSEEDRAGAHRGITAALGMERTAQVRVVAVGQLRRKRTDREVWEAVLRGDEDLRVRLAALKRLGDLDGDLWAASILTEALQDTNDLVRAAAVRSLAKIKPDGAFELVVAQLDRPGWQAVCRSAALEAFGDLGDERAFDRLVHYAAWDADPRTRGAAIRTLGRMGKSRPEYRDAVVPHLSDPHRDVRKAAAEALKQQADPDAIGPLLEALAVEPWHRTRKAMEAAVKSCRNAAVLSGRLVSTESVRGAALRTEHAIARAELDRLSAALKKTPADKTLRATTDARRKSVKKLKRELDRLGVAPVPKSPPPKNSAPDRSAAGGLTGRLQRRSP